MCIDFVTLNKQMKIDAYPIPQIDEILDCIYKAQVFSQIDLSKAYHQVAIELSHMHTRLPYLPSTDCLKFLVLPFGLVNAPSTF